MLWLLALAPAVAIEPPPTEHTLIYYNARMALREGRSNEALKLWLLRNALEDQTRTVSGHDDDFASVMWAATGELGLCQDGIRRDADGVGLWPLGLHNWVVRNMRRRPQKRPKPFDAFKVERQQRNISLTDVLTAPELRSAEFYRGRCLRPRTVMLDAGENPLAKLADREVASRLLRYLLRETHTSLDAGKVRGRSVIEARLFDIGLQLTALAERKARAKARRQAVQGRQLGISREAATAIREEAPAYSFSDDSEPAQVLRACLEWSTDEWMALSPERRLFLFDHARNYGGDPAKLEGIALGIIDHLITTNQGREVALWIAHRAPVEDTEGGRPVWDGVRGERLLNLDDESGFNERSVIALHRGVDQLEAGDLEGALRSMAFSLKTAPESSTADAVTSLGLRWLSYIAAQFELTDELLAVLKQTVPRREYTIILEDLEWTAAFHTDQISFDRGLRNQLGRGALGRRLELLVPLARGDLGKFGTGIRDGLEESPSETLRFLEQFLERLETEDADVRTRHLPTLTILRRLLTPLTAEEGGKGRLGRTSSTLVARFQSIQEGLVGLGLDATPTEKARSLGPANEVFAGSLRLAPSDPLPWPFRPSKISAPSVFSPILIRPLEWRTAAGERVFGWSIRE